MKLKINCPTCNQKLRIPLKLKKIRVRCPKCGAEFLFGFKFIDKLLSIFDFKKNVKLRNFDLGGYTNFEYTNRIVRLFIFLTILLIFLFTVVYFLKPYSIKVYKQRKLQQLQQQYNTQKDDTL